MKPLIYTVFGFLLATLLTPVPVKSIAPPVVAPVLSHQQLAWSYALEYCESNGLVTAINPRDSDGTPSYGSFQFKPSSFHYFADLYHVTVGTSSDSYMDPEKQREILTQMLIHSNQIVWRNQFPNCVRKIGEPPAVLP